jgi:photosystem II stability/assembly factor-like uncharacterized protein
MRRFSSLFLLLVLFALALPATAAGAPIAGQWRDLGPDGANIVTLAVHPTDPQVVYAGGIGGVFRSTDGGASWSAANQGLSLRPLLSTVVEVTSLAIDRAHPATLYAGLNADGVAKSTDGGASWTHVEGGLRNFAISALALDPTNGDRLFAATFDGLYRTGDGGANWRRLTRGLPGDFPAIAETVTLDPTAPQTAYAAFGDLDGKVTRLFKSVNGGATWRLVSSGPLDGRFLLTLAVDPLAPQTLYAGCRDGLFQSRDGGASWQATGISGPNVFSLAIHPTRPGTVYAGTSSGLLRTTDGGAHWSPLNSGLETHLALALAFSPASPRTLFAGTSLSREGANAGGVYKTTNAAASWTFVSRGMKAQAADSLAVDPKTPTTLWLGTDLGLFKSRDRGESWSRLDFTQGCQIFGPQSIALDPAEPDTAYLATQGTSSYGVCATHDGGATWSLLYLSPDPIFQVRVDPLNPAVVYAAGQGIVKSTDRGAHWAPVGGNLARLEILDLVLSSAPPATLYAVGAPPRPFLVLEVLRSTDGGQSWTNLGSPTGSGFFEGLALDALDPQTLYLSDFGTLLRSSDGGAHWATLSQEFFHHSGKVAVLPSAPDRLYFAARGDAVYESADGGGSWSPLGKPPDHVLFTFVTGDPQDPNRIYVGSSGGALQAFTKEP